MHLWQSDNQILDLCVNKVIIETSIIFQVAKANGDKEWRYLFILAGQIRLISSFAVLAERFKEL